MNNEYFKPCTKCGRPQTFCKGTCCKQPKGCECPEYGPKVCGAIRPGQPECPYQAVIPSLTVESVNNLKDLADCFVHVVDINTTFYIDDKHRIMTTWAGLVSVDDYDFEANPLNLRGQIAYDAKNNKAAIYDKQGANYIFQISDIENDYMLLENKPAINGVTLEGDKSLKELDIPAIEEVALVFDTVADMKASDKLVFGGYARTLGFHSVNDGGGSLYYITDSGTADEMQVIAVGSLYANLVLTPIMNVKQFGAIGDGATDDSSYFTKALSVGKKIYADGTFLVNNAECHNDIVLEFSPNTKIIRTAISASNISGSFEFSGTVGDHITLTADANALEQHVTVNDASTLNIGDIIIVRNDTEDGELSCHRFVTRITGISSNTLQIDLPLPHSFLLTNSAYVQKVNPIKVQIIGNGVEFTTDQDEAGRGYFTLLKMCTDSTVKGLTVNYAPTGACLVEYCYNVNIEECEAKNPVTVDTPFSEMISIYYSSLITCNKITTSGYRRCVDYIGSYYSKTSESYALRGGFTTHGMCSRFCNFENCIGVTPEGENAPTSNVGNTAFYYDEDITYIGCEFYGGNIGVGCTGQYTTCKVINCIFNGSLASCAASGKEMIIEGCIINSERRCVQISADSFATLVKVKDCILTSSGSGSYYAVDNNSSTVDLIVENCEFTGTTVFCRNTPIKIYNTKINASVSTPIIVKTNATLKNVTCNKSIKVNTDADNVNILDCYVYNVSADGTYQNVTINNLITTGGTMNITADEATHVKVVNHTKITGYTPVV